MPYKDPLKQADAVRRLKLDAYHRLRRCVVEGLGARCAHCGAAEDEVDSMQIDHVNNEGAVERSLFGRGTSYLKEMIEREFEGLQLLCGNCHVTKNTAERRAAKRVMINAFDEEEIPF